MDEHQFDRTARTIPLLQHIFTSLQSRRSSNSTRNFATFEACPLGQFFCGNISSMIYLPPLANLLQASSKLSYFPGTASAKMRLKEQFELFASHSFPSSTTSRRRPSRPRWRNATPLAALSLSTEIRDDPSSMPSSNQAVANPVPVPSSSRSLLGQLAARARNKTPVFRSEDTLIRAQKCQLQLPPTLAELVLYFRRPCSLLP